MGHSNFWCLSHPDSTRRLAGWTDEVDTEQIICPLTRDHMRGGKRITDLSVTLPRYRVQDFVWTWGSECLIQDRVLELFRENRFSGFEVKPVRARYRRAGEGEPPRLWELAVTGWGGVAPALSGIKLVEECRSCGYLGYSSWTNAGGLLDPSEWDGSDIFMVWPLPRYIFVTDRVAQVARRHKLSGILLRRSKSLVFPESVIPGLSPGRLSYWMPAERARELGAPLGIE